MIIRAENFKSLVAVRRHQIIHIPIMVLRKPISESCQKQYPKSICIVCDYKFKEHNIQFANNIKAVCHPFRDDSIFKGNIKKYLFSESDFCSKWITETKYKMSQWGKKRYDFVYFTLFSRHGIHCKGTYMLSLIDHVARLLNLRGLVVNYDIKDDNKKYSQQIYIDAEKRIHNFVDGHKYTNLHIKNKCFSSQEVCAIMKSCKFVIFPNVADASPRLLTEAIVRNVPVVVNEDIYGGWKYVEHNTGRFFKGPTLKEFVQRKDSSIYIHSLKNAVKEVLTINPQKVAATFYKQYGFVRASKKLASIINEVCNKKYKAVAFKEWEKVLRNVAYAKHWI